MSVSNPQSKNLVIGRQTSLANRQRRAELHDRMVWELVLVAAHYAKPQTLRSFVKILNNRGIRSANGGPWTTAKLGHLFKRHETTPKEVSRRYGGPNPYKAHAPLPKKAAASYRKALARIDEPSGANGVWHSATTRLPRRVDLVRHGEFGEGQFIAEPRIGKLRCRFLDDEGTYDVVVPTNQIEWFEYFRSREERQRLSEMAWERYFGDSV